MEPTSKEPTQTEEQPSSSGNAEGLQKDAGTQQPNDNGSTGEEEQPSSFFSSLFSIVTKPFSLIISFFSGFFSWLFGFNEEEFTSQTDALLKVDSLNEKKTGLQPDEDSSDNHLFG
ncbi:MULTISPECIES: hypothetical protein [Wolbachia]|uniref:hypothetical protein n=1 Tax=Wolbachia TaxID=953 RepID=UPI002175648E|nr:MULTISPECIES: hypothetical protein [Wolbachia]MDE5060927.1 hypothetical protein [Wolbachia endosymbiont of Drosophila nikananu]